jgi:predicted 3-demethylubiquinone-9 3-methyltransferase (glyoxalase superfamily)
MVSKNTICLWYDGTALDAATGQESACGWCKDKWGLSWQIAQRPNEHSRP